MNSYNKATLNRIAKEQGFIRDNLEKVMRMVEILRYFSGSALLSQTLALERGHGKNMWLHLLVFLNFLLNLQATIIFV